jgi:anti-sigma regulatory factor (Ser/Thr protein kinase)
MDRMSGQHVADADLRHAAFLYRDQPEYLAQILGFARAGLARGEPVLIAVPGNKLRLLESRLATEPGEVLFRDMADLGRNPARIIPAVRAFADKHAGQRFRFVGEPIWPGRSAVEICEAVRHEALINLAFAQTAVTILCPYDAARLVPSAMTGARRTHAELLANGRPAAAAGHSAPWEIPPECDRPLPPPADAETVWYETDLAPVRQLVASHARHTGLAPERVSDLVLAASEIAANTLGHTRSGGTLQVWHDQDEVICQVQDEGHIADPLAGRVRHSPESRGHGLFLVNQVCDLVEMRSGADGTTVRMHMRLPRP